MGSSGKRKTTFAKLNRERGLVERRMIKAARKAERKRAAAEGESPQYVSDREADAAEAEDGDSNPS